MQYQAGRWMYRTAYLILLVGMSGLITGMFLRSPGIIGDGRADFYHQIDGAASRPFVYRTLIPTTIRTLTAPINDETRQSLAEWGLNNSLVHEVFSTSAWRIDWLPEFAMASALMFLFLLAWLWSLNYLTTGIYSGNRYGIDALIFLGLLGLPPFFTATNYIYDLPALFFFTLGLALMIRRQWIAYLIVFFLASLNKETTILLTMIFVLYFFNQERMNRREYIQWLVAQLLIFAVIRIILMVTFADNPGGALRFQADFNFRLFTMQTYTLPEYFTWIGLGLLVFYKWREKPLFLRYGSTIIVPLLGLMLLFGIITETRVFYEIYPIVLLLIFHSISRILEFELSTKSAESDLSYSNAA